MTRPEAAKEEGAPVELPLIFEFGARRDGAFGISPSDRGFLFGDTLFETLRVEGGRALLAERHDARLERALRAARYTVTLEEIGLHEARNAALEAALEAGWQRASLRMTVSRGTGGRGLSFRGAAAWGFASIGPFAPPSEEQYEAGLRAKAITTARSALAPAALGKQGNYFENGLALIEAEEAGLDEALLSSVEGFLLGGSSSNVLWVRDGVLHSTPGAAGILDGITRDVVEEAARSLGIPCRREFLRTAEIPEQDEVFLTSSLREIMAVTSLDGQRIGSGRRGDFTARLTRAYVERVRGTTA